MSTYQIVQITQSKYQRLADHYLAVVSWADKRYRNRSRPWLSGRCWAKCEVNGEWYQQNKNYEIYSVIERMAFAKYIAPYEVV